MYPEVTRVGHGRCDAGDLGERAILDLGVRLSSRTWGLEVGERGWSSGERSRGDVGDGDTGRYMHSPGSPASCCKRGSHRRSVRLRCFANQWRALARTVREYPRYVETHHHAKGGSWRPMGTGECCWYRDANDAGEHHHHERAVAHSTRRLHSRPAASCAWAPDTPATSASPCGSWVGGMALPGRQHAACTSRRCCRGRVLARHSLNELGCAQLLVAGPDSTARRVVNRAHGGTDVPHADSISHPASHASAHAILETARPLLRPRPLRSHHNVAKHALPDGHAHRPRRRNNLHTIRGRHAAEPPVLNSYEGTCRWRGTNVRGGRYAREHSQQRHQ
jgi:hypothetical protein